MTPVEKVMSTLDDLVRAGKVRYIGVSNFSGWQLMKSLAAADRYGLHTLRREPNLLLADRPRLRVGADAARARSGRRRDRVEPARLGPLDRQDPTRAAVAALKPAARDGAVRAAVGRRATVSGGRCNGEVAAETGKTVPQIAINWLLQRPTVATRADRRTRRGAAARQPRRRRLAALTPSRWRALDTASAMTPPYPYYPYWNGQFAERNPPPVAVRSLKSAAL